MKSDVFIATARLEKNDGIQTIIHGVSPIWEKHVLFICEEKGL